MIPSEYHVDTDRYAKCIEGSKRIRWDIDNDVIRGREFDFSKKFLPEGISQLDRLPFLSVAMMKLFLKSSIIFSINCTS